MDASCQLSWSLRCDGDRLFIVMPGRNNVAMCSCSLALRSQLRVVYDRQLKVGKSSALCRSSKTIKPPNTDLQDPIKTQISRSLRFLSPFTRGVQKGQRFSPEVFPWRNSAPHSSSQLSRTRALLLSPNECPWPDDTFFIQWKDMSLSVVRVCFSPRTKGGCAAQRQRGGIQR